MKRLALTLPHVDGETITSFVSRVAYRNRYDNAGGFCGDVGLDWTAIIRGDDRAFHDVATLMGAASERLPSELGANDHRRKDADRRRGRHPHPDQEIRAAGLPGLPGGGPPTR